MQFINVVRQRSVAFTNQNSGILLTAAGIVGTVATAVLAGRGGYKASAILAAAKLEKLDTLERAAVAKGEPEPEGLPELTRMETLVLVGPHILPALVTGGATITAIVFAHKVSAQKAAALAAAYGLAERNLSEYKEKVSEKITGPKQKAIEEELAQDAVNQTPGHNNIVIVEGDVLCFDKPTGRYFRSNMDTIRAAVNSTNAEINHHDHALASFFYEELSLDKTTWSDMVGWNTDQLLELTYSTVLTDDGKPCLAIDFKTMPREDYNSPKHY